MGNTQNAGRTGDVMVRGVEGRETQGRKCVNGVPIYIGAGLPAWLCLESTVLESGILFLKGGATVGLCDPGRIPFAQGTPVVSHSPFRPLQRDALLGASISHKERAEVFRQAEEQMREQFFQV